jgi:ribosome-associated heat shock protein Hsp15
LPDTARPTVRLDKWLWFARLCKTRSLAAREVADGRVRLNGTRTTKPAQAVGPGDTLTYGRGDRVLVVRILAPGTRRGPAPEALALYDDLSEPAAPPAPGTPAPIPGGRPTGKDRRRLVQTRTAHLD